MVGWLTNMSDVARVFTKCCAASNIRGGAVEGDDIVQDFEQGVTSARWAADDPDGEDPDAETIPDIILEVLRREYWPPVLSDDQLRERRSTRYGDCH